MPTTVGAFTQAAIESAITTALSGDGKVYCPGGTYAIDTGINLVNKAGLEIYGDAPWMPGVNLSNPGYACTWKWTGSDGGTIFRLNGHRCKIHDICFNGSYDSSPAGSAAIGLLLAAAIGWGCNNNHIEDCVFYNFTYNTTGEANTLRVGLQMGESSGDSNCADTVITRCYWWAAGVGIRTVNDQSVNNSVYDPNFFYTNTCLDIQRGGKLRVINPSMIACDTLLKVTQGGPNVGYYWIFGASVEPWGWSQKYSAALYAADAADIMRVVFDGYQEGGRDTSSDAYLDNNATRFRINSKVTLNTRNLFLKSNGWPVKTGAGFWVDDGGGQFEDDVYTNADIGGGRGRYVQDDGIISRLARPMSMATTPAIFGHRGTGEGVRPKRSTE